MSDAESMKVGSADGDIVIVLDDYYGGDIEGLARIGGECSYFLRVSPECDGVYDYASVAIEASIFTHVVALLDPEPTPGKLYVYAGSNTALDRYLETVIPSMRVVIERVGRFAKGRNYMEAAARGIGAQPTEPTSS